MFVKKTRKEFLIFLINLVFKHLMAKGGPPEENTNNNQSGGLHK